MTAITRSPVFRYLLVVLALGTVTPAPALDLMESYLRARENDPTYAMAAQALEAGRERVPQARAGLLPTVAATGSYGRADNEVRFGKSDDEGRNVESYSWNVQLTQPLFRFQNWASYSQAGAQVEQAEAEFAQVKQDLILRVTQAYFDVLLAKDGIHVAEAQEAALRQQAAQAEHSFKAGVVPITDVHEAKSRLGLASAQKHAANSTLESAQAELEKLTGSYDSEISVLRDDFSMPRDNIPTLDEWIKAAHDYHPVVIAKAASVRVLEKEVSKNRAAHLPTLDMTASYGTNYTSGTTSVVLDTESSTRSSQVGVQVSLPLFGGGAVSARVNEAEANVRRARFDLELARRDASTDARKNYSDFNNGLGQVAALMTALDSGRTSVEANTAGYRVGVRSNLDVLTAEQVLHTATRDLAKAKYEVLISWMRLRASAGQLNEADVSRLNSMVTAELPLTENRNSALSIEPKAKQIEREHSDPGSRLTSLGSLKLSNLLTRIF